MAGHGIKVEKADDKKPRAMKATTWPPWTKDVSTFDWHDDEPETCYLLEGDVEVTTAAGRVCFGAGDLVSFPVGLDCTWNVKKAGGSTTSSGEADGQP
jgi:uncharacterized protein